MTKKEEKAAAKALEKAIELVGSSAELARLLNVSRQSVASWHIGKSTLPPVRAVQIEVLTHGEITREKLRPDYPWVTLATTRAQAKRGEYASTLA
jgi:DNA-binding transcriptional regulator YdaS (Cro superfamily)